MKKNDWTQRLPDLLANHQEAVPDGLWADIEKSLNSRIPVGPPPTVKSDRVILFRRMIAAAAVLLVFILGGVYLYMHDYNALVIKPVITKMSTFPSKEGGRVARHSILGKYMLANVQNVKRNGHSVLHNLETEQSVTKQNKRQIITESLQNNDVVSPSSTNEANEIKVAKQHIFVCPNNSSVVSSHSLHVYHRNHTNGLSLNLYASNAVIGNNTANGVQMSDQMLNNYTSVSAKKQPFGPVYLMNYKETEHHHQPVSFGLTVEYGITTHMSLVTGVVYTNVSSDFKREMKGSVIMREQNLQYIGVPLNVNYQVWDYKKLKAYITVGGECDVNIKAKSTTDGVDVGMECDRMQWSTNAAVGVQYDIIPHLGIYVEPGLKYYFDNGSKVKNIFKDKPLNPSLQLGLRFCVK